MPKADHTALHLFVVSLRCDYSCKYCQVSRQTDDKLAYDMSQETADRSLDFVFKSPSPAIKIEFQGGEPLLNFPIIRYVVEKAKERNREYGKDLQFVITTNMSLLTDEVLAFCLAHDIHLSTSLDGPEDLHNRNRPRPGRNGHQLTVEGIKKAQAVLGRDKVGALMTTTEASLSRVREIIDMYLALGIDGIFLRPLSPYGFAIKNRQAEKYNVDRWFEFYKEGLDYVLEINRQGHLFVELYASLIINKIFSPFGTGYVDLQSPSGMAISAIVYNYDGDIYAADEARMLAEMGEKKFRLGNVYQDNYEDVMTSDILLDTLEATLAESAPMCNDCGFLPYCGTDPVYHYATQKDAVGHKAFSGFCSKNMKIFRHIFTLLQDDPEARKILLSWVRP
ncbi:His-Xaa-Ser system radical SAM maturase HxsB [Nitrosospira multiformis]|nr:His-Xaa-Ser system radical SAM maturase HxsB [Nitrosospira multiformis]